MFAFGIGSLARTLAALLVAIGAAACCFAAPAAAAVDTVTNLNDSGSGSLRAVAALAGAGDTIVFAGGLKGTVTLTSGAIPISQDLSVAGPGAGTITISGAHATQIFSIAAGNVSISGLTLADGSVLTDGGAVSNQGTGQLTIAAVTATGSTAGQGGGAIFSDGPLSVDGSTFSGDSAGGPGGALPQSGAGAGGAIGGASSIVVTDSSFSGNSAGGPGGTGDDSGTGDGGAIAGSPLTVTNSSFSDNTAGGNGAGGDLSGSGDGGAIYSGSLTLAGSTFSANSAGGAGSTGTNSGEGGGGAVWTNGPLTTTNSSFTNNSAGGTGSQGVGSGSGDGGAVDAASIVISGSTFASNFAGGDGGAGQGSGLGRGGGLESYSGTNNDIVSNSTFYGNSAGGAPSGTTPQSGEGDGGAVQLVFGLTTFSSDTIDANTVGNTSTSIGAGIAGEHDNLFKALDTIVSGNMLGATPANCSEPADSTQDSLEGPAGQTSCAFDLTSADPQLSTLAANGGPTQTQAPAPGSPAIDAVPTAHCPTTTDQRGLPRPDAGETTCDVGAYEVQDPSVAISTPLDTASFPFGAVPPVEFACTAGAGATLKSGVNGCSATVDGGSPTTSGTPLAGAVGAHAVTATATDADGQATTATANYSVTAAATNITPESTPYSTGYQQPLAVSASLTSAATGAGVQNESLTFTLAGAETCTAITDASGFGSCSITPGEVPGAYTLAVSYAGDTDYQLSDATTSFTVTQVAQTVSFNSTAPTSVSFGSPGYSVSAAASSGLPVAITIDPSATGVCSISGSTVTFIGVGTCQIDADQAGNPYYAAAQEVTQSFTVSKAQQMISFNSSPPSHATVGGATYSVTASSDSGLPVAIAVDPASTAVCAISGGTVSFTALGTCTLDANQPGNADYDAAAQVSQTFTVHRPPTIQLALNPPSVLANGTTETTATATVTDPDGTPVSGDHLSFASSDSGEAIGSVTDHGDGTYSATITASKTVGSATITATDRSVNPSPSATATLSQISKLPQLTAALQSSSIGADGQATTVLTAKLTASSKGVAGAHIQLRSSDPGESFGAVTDHGNGTYTATVTASRIAGTDTITVTDESVGPHVSATVQLKQVAPKIVVSVKPASIRSSSTATITATVTAGSGLTRDHVTFAASDPGDTIGPISDHGNGVYTAVIAGSGMPGSVTIKATDSSPNPIISATTTLTQS